MIETGGHSIHDQPGKKFWKVLLKATLQDCAPISRARPGCDRDFNSHPCTFEQLMQFAKPDACLRAWNFTGMKRLDLVMLIPVKSGACRWVGFTTAETIEIGP